MTFARLASGGDWLGRRVTGGFGAPGDREEEPDGRSPPVGVLPALRMALATSQVTPRRISGPRSTAQPPVVGASSPPPAMDFRIVGIRLDVPVPLVVHHAEVATPEGVGHRERHLRLRRDHLGPRLCASALYSCSIATAIARRSSAFACAICLSASA